MTLKVLEHAIDELSDGLTFMYYVEDELSDRSATSSYNFALNDSVV